jgi:hypothetical protein
LEDTELREDEEGEEDDEIDEKPADKDEDIQD